MTIIKKIEELISKSLFSVRWREVFILLAGIVGKADDLLKRMQRVAEKRLAGSVQVFQLMQWANSRGTPVEDAVQAAVQRTFALSLALSLARARDQVGVKATERTRGIEHVLAPRDYVLDLAFAFSRERDFSRILNRARVLDRSRARAADNSLTDVLARARFGLYVGALVGLFSELDSSQFLLGEWGEARIQLQATRDNLKRNASFEEIGAAWDKVLNIFASSLQLPPSLYSLGDRHALDEYLYVLQLIVDCKNAATRINRSTWDDICHRVLNLRENLLSEGAQTGRGRKSHRV